MGVLQKGRNSAGAVDGSMVEVTLPSALSVAHVKSVLVWQIWRIVEVAVDVRIAAVQMIGVLCGVMAAARAVSAVSVAVASVRKDELLIFQSMQLKTAQR